MAATEYIEMREAVLERLESGAASELRDLVSDMHPADIASVLEGLPSAHRLSVWFQIPEQAMGEILAELSDGVREFLISEMDPAVLVRAVSSLDIDEIADMVPYMPSRVVAEIMISVDQKQRQVLDTRLSYEEGSVGRLMDAVDVTIRKSLPIRVILRFLRHRGELSEHTDRLFVVDREGVLQGVLLLRKLVTANLEERVEDIMDPTPMTFLPQQPAEEVAAAITRYNLGAGTIVDESGKLLGRLTIDDILEVVHESEERKLMVQSGLDNEEDLFAPITLTARRRAVWLGVNLITAVVASWVIGLFESTIEKLVALAVLMPIIASMGGNAGTQTLTSVIRGIGLGTISKSNAKHVLKKEFLVGGLNGMAWAVAVAIIAIIWYQNIGLAAIVALAMLVNIGVSTLSGVLLPIFLDRIGIDPSLAGGVALTTVTDVVGFFAILGLAALLLV